MDVQCEVNGALLLQEQRKILLLGKLDSVSRGRQRGVAGGRSRRQPRRPSRLCFFFNDTATTEIYTLSLHDALPISVLATVTTPAEAREAEAAAGRTSRCARPRRPIGSEPTGDVVRAVAAVTSLPLVAGRSEEHTSELQSQFHLVCRLLLEKKKKSQLAPRMPKNKVARRVRIISRIPPRLSDTSGRACFFQGVRPASRMWFRAGVDGWYRLP